MGQTNAERCTSTGTIKGCGRRALWDRHGKPVVVLYATAESDGERVWTCADCIARAGVSVSEMVVPADCQCVVPGCKRPRCSDRHRWRLCDLPWHGAQEAEQTDGAVQEEVTDSLQAIEALTKIPKPPNPAARLVRERYATWAKRAHKWHAYLERERAWSAHGRVLSVLTGAASTISAATVAPHYAAGVVGALMVATALIAWRGQVAQARLDSARLADAWVSAERIAELYRGLVVELDAVITTCDDFMRCETAEQVLVKSQQLEAKARFGVPEDVRAALVEAAK